MKKKSIMLIVGILLFSILVLVFNKPYRVALTKSKNQFKKNAKSENVYYEVGSKEHADKIADFLPQAIKTIEEKQFSQFSKSFKIYVCNTQKSLNEYIAEKSLYPIRGTVLNGNIFIAPSAFSFEGKNTYKETLLHELSHLHFRQKLGFFKDRKIPAWFREGFADYVAGSGGEGIENNEAIDFILNNKHFIPIAKGEVFGSFFKERNGLSNQMFHKQAKMFVTYLAEYDSVKFKNFVQKIQNGKLFSTAFSETMNSTLDDQWETFITQTVY